MISRLQDEKRKLESEIMQQPSFGRSRRLSKSVPRLDLSSQQQKELINNERKLISNGLVDAYTISRSTEDIDKGNSSFLKLYK